MAKCKLCDDRYNKLRCPNANCPSEPRNNYVDIHTGAPVKRSSSSDSDTGIGGIIDAVFSIFDLSD